MPALELLRQILNIAPDTKIIAMTEHDARDLAVQAVGLGATDFYHKPINAAVLSIVVRRAFRIRELEEENGRLREQTGAMALEGIIGVSDAMRSLCRAVEKVAPTNATVLVLGESGTGKELMARALHRLSGRSHQPFVAINCAAIPDTLLESELFGYEKGAFTGAAKRTAGKLELADTGTVFLDEIGEMPASLAGEAAARSSGAHGGSHWRALTDSAGSALHLRDPPADRSAHRGHDLPRRSLLPHQRSHDSSAASAGAAGR